MQLRNSYKSYESGVSKKNISIFMIGTGTMNRWIRKYGGGYLTIDELLYGEDAEIIPIVAAPVTA